jgi:hypothetical protein
MASKIEIINMALRRLGEQPIAAIDEGSEPANVMADIYDMVLENELRQWSWPFAITTAELAQVSGEEPPDWGYAFQLPAGYMQMVKLIDPTSGVTLREWDFYSSRWGYSTVEYEIREGKLYINLSEITIKYIYNQTDTSKFDSAFTLALSRRLAWEAAPSITEREDIAQAIRNEYYAYVSQARGNAGVESRQRLDISREYVRAR